MVKIWRRHLIAEILKTLLIALACIDLLYVAIDYTLHVKLLGSMAAGALCSYYLGEILANSGLLLPFALLISCLRVLTHMSARGELVALLAAGLSKFKIASTLLAVATLLTLLLYANEQWPIRNEVKGSDQLLVYRGEGTLLAASAEENLFWLRSSGALYHIERFSEGVAYGVTAFGRGSQGELTVLERVPQMKISSPFTQIKEPNSLPLTYLAKAISHKSKLTDRERAMKASLFRRLALPLLCPLAVLAVAPLAMRYRRGASPFALFVTSIALFFAAYALLDALSILIES